MLDIIQNYKLYNIISEYISTWNLQVYLYRVARLLFHDVSNFYLRRGSVTPSAS